MMAATATTTVGAQTRSSLRSVDSRTTLIHLPLRTSQSNTSSKTLPAVVVDSSVLISLATAGEFRLLTQVSRDPS